MSSADSYLIREGTRDDLQALVDLKIQWAALTFAPSAEDRDGFADVLDEWMRSMGDSVACKVAEVSGELVGMAWLVIFERVPDIRNRRRTTGDIQSVFVQPEYRGSGIGAALIEALTDLSDRCGVLRVTVGANEPALSLYTKAGFATSPVLLE